MDELDCLGTAVKTVPGLEQPANVLTQHAAALPADRFTIVIVGGFNRGKSTLLKLALEIVPGLSAEIRQGAPANLKRLSWDRSFAS